jgi:hypothetical protein
VLSKTSSNLNSSFLKTSEMGHLTDVTISQMEKLRDRKVTRPSPWSLSSEEEDFYLH